MVSKKTITQYLVFTSGYAAVKSEQKKMI